MNKYTIEYWYATYHGTEIIYADDEESAVYKMWKYLLRDGSMGMVHQSHKIIDVEYNYDGE
ncbi:hypothetical protein QQ054_32025 [Oscillatoria amoena NRMC-F 0135]|nr:hypothetical protein [Oscillatoria amoena NRMC-F 0135]